MGVMAVMTPPGSDRSTPGLRSENLGGVTGAKFATGGG